MLCLCTSIKASRNRIEASGGIVAVHPVHPNNDGPQRVWLNQESMDKLNFSKPLPGLMISRSLGDDLAKLAGCSCVPELVSMQLRPEHVGIVVASDGLWDIVAPDKCADAIRVNATKDNWSKVSTRLLDISLKGWAKNRLADNITIVAFLLDS